MTEPGQAMTLEQAERVTVPFGKRYGWPLKALLDRDPGYFEWLRKKSDVRKAEVIAALAVLAKSEHGKAVLAQFRATRAKHAKRRAFEARRKADIIDAWWQR